MNEIIKAIFLSNFHGRDFIKPINKEYEKLNKKEYELYNKLETSLSPELLKLFDEFINAFSDRNAIINEQYYTTGFKVGLRLAMEAFNLSDGCDL